MLDKYLFWHRCGLSEKVCPISALGDGVRHFSAQIYTYLISILALLLILLVAGAPVVYAQDATNQDAVQNITRDEVNEVASELYCPLCSGVRLDACELQACDQMREEIALQLANGVDKAAIKASFLNQYGPQVLGEPPRDSLLNWLAWILPFAALGIAGLWLLLRGRRRGLAQTVAASSMPVAAPPAGQNGQVRPPRATDDEYIQKLDEELRQYE